MRSEGLNNTRGLEPRYLRERKRRAAMEAMKALTVSQPLATEEPEQAFRSMDALTPQLRRRVADAGWVHRLLPTVTLPVWWG